MEKKIYGLLDSEGFFTDDDCDNETCSEANECKCEVLYEDDVVELGHEYGDVSFLHFYRDDKGNAMMRVFQGDEFLIGAHLTPNSIVRLLNRVGKLHNENMLNSRGK